MYSKNDYQYYLENQLTHSDDFLAHYGVNNYLIHERSHKYIKKIGNRYFYTQAEIEAYLKKKADQLNPKKKFDENYRVYKDTKTLNTYGKNSKGETVKTGTYKAKYRGIESKKAYKYVDLSTHEYSDGRKTQNLYFTPTKKPHEFKKGRVEFSSSDEGSRLTVDVTKKKKPKKKSRVVSSPDKNIKLKRSRFQERWNKKMQRYGKEALKEME